MKRRPLFGIVFLTGFVLLLEVICRFGFLDVRFFPAPSATLSRLARLLSGENDFWQHLSASGVRYVLGVLLSVLFAIPLAAAAGLSRNFRSILNSAMGIVYPLPKSAIFPFVLLVFGLNDQANIALIVSGCLTLILTALIAGCARLEASGYFSLAQSLRLPAWKRLRYVIVPGLWPEFFQGLKLGTSYALVLLIISEMIATRYGVGVFLWHSWDQFHILDLYAVLYLVSIFGILLFGVFEKLAELSAESQKGL